jgi:pimeloyl-ACP methyl ester carboxylesterase
MIQLYWQQGAGPWMAQLWMTWPPDIFKGAAGHPKLWQRLVDVVNQHSWREIGDFSMQELTAYNQTTAMLEQIKTPTLVLVGDGEMEAFKECAAIIQKHVPNCTCLYLPQTGHLCMLEVPATAAQLMAEHFRRYDNGNGHT